LTGLLALIILRRRRRHAVQAHGDARDAVPGSLHRHPDGESPCSWGVDLPELLQQRRLAQHDLVDRAEVPRRGLAAEAADAGRRGLVGDPATGGIELDARADPRPAAALLQNSAGEGFTSGIHAVRRGA